VAVLAIGWGLLFFLGAYNQEDVVLIVLGSAAGPLRIAAFIVLNPPRRGILGADSETNGRSHAHRGLMASMKATRLAHEPRDFVIATQGLSRVTRSKCSSPCHKVFLPGQRVLAKPSFSESARESAPWRIRTMKAAMP